MNEEDNTFGIRLIVGLVGIFLLLIIFHPIFKWNYEANNNFNETCIRLTGTPVVDSKSGAIECANKEKFVYIIDCYEVFDKWGNTGRKECDGWWMKL